MVSWKLAAEIKLELCTLALVMPSSWVLAVAGFGWMNELRRRTGTGERRRNFIADMPTLSHSADNNSTPYGREKVHSVSKTLVDSLRKLLNGLSLNGDGSLGRLYSGSWRITV